jgi:hypothetical protein
VIVAKSKDVFDIIPIAERDPKLSHWGNKIQSLQKPTTKDKNDNSH